MLINFGDELDKVDKIRQGILKEAPKIGIEEIDNVIRFKKNVTCFAGHANVGKTSVILFFMMLFAQKHKIKFLVFSSENEPYSIIRKLVEYKASKPINKISKQELHKHSTFVNKHFKFIDCEKNYDYLELLSLCEVIYSQSGFDCLIIDPINSLRKNKSMMKFSNAYEYLYEMMTDFRIFVKKYKVGIWLIMHSVTEAFRKRYATGHEYVGHPLPLAMSDVEGGNVYGNRTDDFYTIHRLTQHEQRWIYTELHCKKIKDHDTGTKPTGFDSPLVLESIVNNVGYKLENQTTTKKSIIEQLNFPF
tara:strand:+ start:491 stop:1402 length:912 start_codon:yes stop_codon:yes gene_type:complete